MLLIIEERSQYARPGIAGWCGTLLGCELFVLNSGSGQGPRLRAISTDISTNTKCIQCIKVTTGQAELRAETISDDLFIVLLWYHALCDQRKSARRLQSL